MNDEKIAFISDTKIHGNVSRAANHRYQAVGIALELIKSSCAGSGPAALGSAMSNLSKYTNKIQEALKEGANPDNQIS